MRIVNGAKKFWEWIFTNQRPILTIATYIVFFIAVLKKVYYVSAADDIPSFDSNWYLLLGTLLGLHVVSKFGKNGSDGDKDKDKIDNPPIAPPKADGDDK